MDHVPQIYHGLWQRTLYAEPANGEPTFVDRDTQVYWLQAGDWHADLRVPTDRPDFTGQESLAACGRDQLEWLASQTAFAGITRVEGRFCTWHRLIDLSPGLNKDIGVMRFIDDDTLEECHPESTYREIWQRVTARDSAEPVVELDAAGLPRWLQYGDHAMAIQPRPAIAGEHDLLAAPAQCTTAELHARAAVNIRYATQHDDAWQVALSTLPWQENRPLVA
ncbi:hypothetical protein SSPSH_003445 [Salinisphaera shabanensis E1L3A]|uniref:Uncharacterized protein n=1 Tax=Salinisphaera shabanensis E1L3A TaxID=1033802 RepID=F7Q637_9GAMM|nr:hypothetical protein [Salinisphaera shabanensis]ERJ17761.1 hypothetical protein SSPSH_003445 [Salinisphaera shabanensis E1L3A]